MYSSFFGFNENPFSIAPDPRYLYMSRMHQEALAHLNYTTAAEGCITLLTGEVGTGKTTVCRRFLEQLDASVDCALLINPALSSNELLTAICDEFRIPDIPPSATTQQLIDRLNSYLLDAYAKNRLVLLIIDEAQNLDPEVLEMIRLLTNLETNRHKLLKIILLGQTELLNILSRPTMAQINQRITSRFHLKGLGKKEITSYIEHRLSTAGNPAPRLFSAAAIQSIYRASRGIPRLVNTICDRALLGAYTENLSRVSKRVAGKAAAEILGKPAESSFTSLKTLRLFTAAVLLAFVLFFGIWLGRTNVSIQDILSLETYISRPAEVPSGGIAGDGDSTLKPTEHDE